MNKAARIFLSLISSGIIVLVFAWGYIIHHQRIVGMAESNVNSFMWSVVWAGIFATIALTWLFYRLVR